MIGKSGWYMDWTQPAGLLPSEKVFSAAVVRSSSPPTLVVSSNVIKINSCGDEGFGFLNAMDAYHGGGLLESYFDINRNRSFADETFVGAGGTRKVISSIDFGHGNIGQGSFSGPNVMAQGSKDVNPDDLHIPDASRPSRRISWREIVK
jgi:Tfp pilus tip-associated adhesin PilY1